MKLAHTLTVDIMAEEIRTKETNDRIENGRLRKQGIKEKGNLGTVL